MTSRLDDAWEDWIKKANLTPELEEELRALRKGAKDDSDWEERSGRHDEASLDGLSEEQLDGLRGLLGLSGGSKLTTADLADYHRGLSRLLREHPKEYGWIHVDALLGGGGFFVAKDESRFAEQHRTTDWRNRKQAEDRLRQFTAEARQARLRTRR